MMRLGLLCTMILISSTAFAQDTDSQFWTLITLNGRFKGGWRLYTEVQPRWGNNYGATSQLLLRPAVGYQIKPNLSVWLGYAWTPSFLPEFNSEDRYFQQFLLEDSYPGLDMINRFRLEQRAISGAGATSLRFRHMLRLSRPLEKTKRWAAVFYNELFWNLNTTPNGPEEGFDQNRAYFGFAYQVTRRTRLELGYLANFVNPPRGRRDRRLDTLVLGIAYNL